MTPATQPVRDREPRTTSIPPRPGDRELHELRTRLDAIDVALLDTIRDRIRCCLQIGEVKRHAGIPMMQPQRIDAVQGRAAAYGNDHGLNPAFLGRVYDVIIAETCRLETEVISGTLPTDAETE